MKIGIDIRPLQIGHKFRGIGEVTKQVTNRLLVRAAKDNNEVIFYEYDGDDAKELLEVPKALHYRTIKLGASHENLGGAAKLKRVFKDMYGLPANAKDADVYLQFDYALGVPRRTKTVLFKHDIIPYLFWNQYFTSAWEPFRRKAARTTLRTLLKNHHFMRVLKRSVRRADRIIAVSESTKRDIEKHLGVRSKKVRMIHLGANIEPAKTRGADKAENMPTKPYLLFVGGGDSRRRVGDLVAAFNNLKAEGHDMQLVLVGENFKKPEHIPNDAIRNEVLHSSYKRDIITLGYVDDETKQKLFREALAFVFPTVYEGFGIMTLEAMLMGCPVIVYKNSSTGEIGGEHALYARNWQDIVEQVKLLESEPKNKRAERIAAARKHAQKFSWDKTAQAVYEELIRK